MTPDLPPVPPGRWLPRLEAARQLGITERTLQRRMKQGIVMTRHDEHNRVQVYVPDPPDTRHESRHDMSMTDSAVSVAEALMTPLTAHAETLARQAEEARIAFLARNAEQETIIRQQAEEIGALRERLETATADHLRLCTEIQAAVEQRNAQLAAQGVPWWRVLWARLSGRAP